MEGDDVRGDEVGTNPLPPPDPQKEMSASHDGEVDDQHQPRRKTMSDAAITANRKNAQRSTGPKTEEGKARSSQNAQTKGIYTRTAWPISTGPYAEDPDEFITRVAVAIKAHAPRDVAEADIAEQIVLTIVKLQRTNRIEADLLASSGSITQADLSMMSKHFGADPRRALVAEAMADHVSRRKPAAGSLYRLMCELVHDVKAGGKITVQDLWTSEREPTDDAEWQRVFDTLVHHFWGDDAEAVEHWANTVGLEANLAQRAFEDALRSREARSALDASDSAARLSDRLIRQLRGLYEVFTQLQKRELADSTTEDYQD
jgi:hypothetical protein